MKLLVNSPNGWQELMDLGDGGEYYDPDSVVWDERIHGLMPAITLGGMKRVGSVLVFDQAILDASLAAELGMVKKELISQVDNTIAGIYQRWMRFEGEYLQRETAAQTFKNGGYVGNPGVWVTAFSSAVGLNNTQAADIILGQAAQLRIALESLGALRMTKYGIQYATDKEAAQAACSNILSQAHAIELTL